MINASKDHLKTVMQMVNRIDYALKFIIASILCVYVRYDRQSEILKGLVCLMYKQCCLRHRPATLFLIENFV